MLLMMCLLFDSRFVIAILLFILNFFFTPRKYVLAHSMSQKYKEGKLIIDKVSLMRGGYWSDDNDDEFGNEYVEEDVIKKNN